MKTTLNYGLKLPEDNDFGDVAVLNENTLALDGLLRAAITAAAEYSPAGIYAVGDYCTHGGKLWRCIAAILAAEPWTPAHWAETNTAAELASIAALAAGKADKLIPAAAGNLAGLDANGNLTDSGKKAGDFLSDTAGAVTTPKLADGAVTEAKLDTGIVKKLNEGGCVLQITFDAAFAGRLYTVTAPGENYGGTVPAGLAVNVFVKNCRTAYTVEATTAAGDKYSITITTGDYFGQYPVRLVTFSAILRVTTKAGAAVTAVSGGNTYTATADGTGLATLIIKQPGTCAVDAVLGGETLSGSIDVSVDGSTYNLKLQFTSAVLEENDWDTISKVSAAGQGANYWKIGDKKKIIINGMVGKTNFQNLTIYPFILGFNHNASVEGNSIIHWQLGKNAAGVDIALVDSKYNTQVTETGWFSMNGTNTNLGGWNSSQMCNTTLGSHSVPTNPAPNTLLAALPPELRAVMKPCIKYRDNTGGAIDSASYVTATTEYLPLLSEFEYFGKTTYVNSAEKNFQKQYDYYKAGNSKVKYRHDATTTAVNVSSGSVIATDKCYFGYVDVVGNPYYSNADIACAVSPSFCT